MRIIEIMHDSIVDGEGFRTVIFFAGCKHHCKGCHNPQTWDFKAGREWTVEEVIAEIKSNPFCGGVTLSGGCPMCNAKDVIPLAKAIKEEGYNIWCYCGETIEQLVGEQLELLKYIDVLVDGEFQLDKRDITIPFRGSTNQRILKNGIDY